jgi:hypothetical protein
MRSANSAIAFQLQSWPLVSLVAQLGSLGADHMPILTLIAVSNLKIELVQSHSGSPIYIEFLKIFLAWPVVIFGHLFFGALQIGGLPEEVSREHQ